jgi:quinoprotein dehydrogenase-associated probable ABC transporter substrate-binding protein
MRTPATPAARAAGVGSAPATGARVAAAAALVALGTWSTAAPAQTADVVSQTAVRVCGDPANMPFSNEAGEGFENKIAELLAKHLGLPLEYTWFPQATGFVRNTLVAKRCDVVIGYAAGGDPVQNTNPYYKSAWTLIYRMGQGLDGVDSLHHPRIKGRRLGVIAGTPPATIMAINGLIGSAKPYALVVDRRFESPAEEMIRDIASGAIDGGVLWGPIGGYFAQRAGAALTIVPLVKETQGPPMTYRVTFGLRHGEITWKHRLNDFIAARQGEINRILVDYGVPLLDEQDRPIPPPR